MPAKSLGSYSLVPPGYGEFERLMFKEVSEEIKAPKNLKNAVNRIDELLDEIAQVLPKILETHQKSKFNEDEYLELKPGIEGADVIQNLPVSLLQAQETIAANVEDSWPKLMIIVEELTRYLYFIDKYKGDSVNCCKHLYLEEETDVLQYRTNIDAVLKKLSL